MFLQSESPEVDRGRKPPESALKLLHKHPYLATVIIVLVIGILALPASQASAETTIETPSVRNEITVTPWGTIQVTRTYRLVNKGTTTISSTTVLLPKDASDITAMDDLGPITSKVVDGEKGRNVTITFRYPLRGEVEGVAYNDAYTFSLHHILASSAYITQPEFGNFRLELNASTGVDSPVAEYAMVVMLPEGSTFSSSNPTGRAEVKGLSPIVSYTLKGLQPREEFHLLINYRFLPIWSAFRPTLWVGTIVAVIGTVLLVRRRFRREEVREEGVDMGLLRDFANSLDEELGLWEDLDQLERALDDGSLGRKDYNRRRRILDERSRSLSGSLSRLKQEVRHVSARYARLVDQVEAAESEMATLWSSFSRTRSQFRAGKLPRRSFENLEQSYGRRVGKVRATIETTIIELRGDMG
jgi:hypothetical protein